MDGIHDLGGLHGFGAVRPEAGEPVFPAPREGRTFALVVATGLAGLRRGSVRPHRRAEPPADDLASEYYERWAFARERAVEGGVLTGAEIDARAAAGDDGPTRSEGTDEPMVARARGFLSRPGPTSGPVAAAFGIGDRVLVGLPPRWYKSFADRARMVREPRAALAEFGTVVPDDVERTEWDSARRSATSCGPSARPAPTCLAEEALAALVTRDHMIGVVR